MIPGTLDYHHERRPTDHGTGRSCAACGARVSRYTQPQPITNLDLCNRHWRLPDGYGFSAQGRIVKEAA